MSASSTTPPPTRQTTTATSTTLLFSPSSDHVMSTSQKDHAASSSDNVAHFTIANHSNALNITDTPTTPFSSSGEGEGLSGGVVALLIILIAVGVIFVSVLIYLKITGKLYRLLPCKAKVTKRRSSTTSSRRPLDVDDPEDEGQKEDDLPVAREVAMFTIDDFEPVHNDEYSRPGNSEEYYYDEVFGQSMFEDEATNASMRQLYLINEDEDDMFDVDTIVSSITGTRHAPTTSAGRKT